MRTLRITGLLVALSAVATGAQAATYYVSSSGGSDARSCGTAQTIGTPKATINSGVPCLQAGDTLAIRGGTYAENLIWFGWPGGTQGTSWATAVTITAYQNEPVTIRPNGGEFVLVMRGSGSGATNAPRYIIFEGITFDAVNVLYDNIKITAYDPTFHPADAPAHHIRFSRCRMTSDLNAAGGGLAITWGSEYVEILNTEIDHAGGAGGTKNSQGIYGAASHLLVDGANIHHNAGYGASNANSYPGLNAIDHITRNSRFYSNGQIVLPSGGLGGGLNEGEGSGHQIYNNLIYDNAGPGLIMAFESGSTGTQIYNNTIYGNGTYGIFIGTAETGVILYNNISYQNGFGNYTNSGTKTTEDRNSRLGVDPLFVNLGARDFKLQAGSPVINQGLTLSLVTTDFAGTTRPQGAAYDIGAYEYGSGVISSPPVITTTSLANGVVSVPYSRTLAATGGTGAYTWSVSVGALSAGLFLTPSTGLISGTPTTSGATSFTARVTDASGQFGTQALTLTVVGGVIITTNTPLPSAETAAAYSVTLAATGDAPPYVWSLANSTPPVGLTLSSAGVLSGTPSTAIADRFFTVRATGSLGSTTTQIVSMSVNSEYRPAFRPISRNTTEGFIFRRRTPPTNPADRVMRGDVWLDTSADPPVFKVCSEASATTAVWVTH